MGDCLRAGKLSRYVTSHPGQLSLAIHLWAGSMSTSLGWESNSRSGLALAMRQTIVVYPPTGLTAYEREISTSPTILRSMALIYLYLLPHLQYVATLPCKSQKFEFVVIYKKKQSKIMSYLTKKNWNVFTSLIMLLSFQFLLGNLLTNFCGPYLFIRYKFLNTMTYCGQCMKTMDSKAPVLQRNACWWSTL